MIWLKIIFHSGTNYHIKINVTFMLFMPLVNLFHIFYWGL